MSLGWLCPRIANTFDEGISELVYASQPVAEGLQQGEVRVAMKACALNYFDLLTLVGRYQVAMQAPFCVASEGSGTVIASNSSKFRVGDEVCGMTFGACQQECLARDDTLVRKPARLSFLQAAAAWVGFLTAFHGLVQRGNLRSGEVVLVTGAAGGMGAIAIQVAKERGARVIATVSSMDKVALCKQAGADAVVVLAADAKAWAKQLKDAAAPFNGVDVCYEVVGGDLFHACSRVINGGGRMLVIGFAGGEIPSLKLNLPLVKGYSVVGVRSGAEMMLHPHLLAECERALAESSIVVPMTVYPVSEVPSAYRVLAGRRAQGKLVIDLDAPRAASKL